MKIHQMIELPGAIANLEDNTPIYIYSTVNIYCSAMDINELVQKYSDDVAILGIEDESADMQLENSNEYVGETENTEDTPIESV